MADQSTASGPPTSRSTMRRRARQDPRVRPGDDVDEPRVPRRAGAAESPPTFLTTVSVLVAAGALGVLEGEDGPAAGAARRRQEYVFHGPPPAAGAELTVQTRVDEIYEKEGKRGGTMTFVVTRHRVPRRDGRARGRGPLHRDRDRQTARPTRKA